VVQTIWTQFIRCSLTVPKLVIGLGKPTISFTHVAIVCLYNAWWTVN